MSNEGTRVEVGTSESEQNMLITEQLQLRELLSEKLLQLLTHLKDLIECKQTKQEINQYEQKIKHIVDQIFNFLVQIFKERGYWDESEAATMERCISAAKEIVVFSLLAHLTFESSWNKPSFHNEIHILAVICAFLKVFFALLLKNEDIFEIRNTLNTWNHKSETSGSSTSPITLREFALAMIMALATHDLGNILQAIQEQEGENPKPIFHEVYCAEGAEERSQAIASVLITKFNQAIDEAKIQQIKRLVQHLIEQTKFQPNPNLTEKETWWLLVQIIDQIGGNVVLLSTNPNYYVSAVTGLIIEMFQAGKDTPINLDNFLDFIAPRLKILVPNEEEAKKILDLLSDQKFNLTSPHLNQANKKNFAYIVKIMQEVFPGRQVSVYTNETNQAFLRISQ
jgi:hypothetical protein